MKTRQCQQSLLLLQVEEQILLNTPLSELNLWRNHGTEILPVTYQYNEVTENQHTNIMCINVPVRYDLSELSFVKEEPRTLIENWIEFPVSRAHELLKCWFNKRMFY